MVVKTNTTHFQGHSFYLAKPYGPHNFVQASDNSRLCHTSENDLQQAQERECQSTIVQAKQPELMVC